MSRDRYLSLNYQNHWIQKAAETHRAQILGVQFWDSCSSGSLLSNLGEVCNTTLNKPWWNINRRCASLDQQVGARLSRLSRLFAKRAVRSVSFGRLWQPGIMWNNSHSRKKLKMKRKIDTLLSSVSDANTNTNCKHKVLSSHLRK